MRSGRGDLKREREERLEPQKVVGMGGGSYIQDSRHLTSLLSHIGVMRRCWGKDETVLVARVESAMGVRSGMSIGVAKRY